ncbi:MAG TPA: hypothetical protein VMG31_01835 [Verrucomicrobiae bacterium]|nr:hypothetical protein [Verrucomicrobiae bacterium]
MSLLRNYSLLWAELGLLLAGAAVASVAPRLLAACFRPLHKIGAQIVRRRAAAFAVALVLPLALRLVALPVHGIATPTVQDEFSFLLMADTFASGRLTNPTHPMWIHFETMHVLQRPSYASMYPVVQGMFLALGQIVARVPWVGVWLSVSLMCGVFYWALLVWMPSIWALSGAALAAIRIGMFSYWMNSYYGGAPAALGGALVLGALPRVFRTQRISDSALLALGLLILANSRPYEGFFFCLPVAFLLFAWILGAKNLCHWFGLRTGPQAHLGVVLRRVIGPIALILIVGGAVMMYYFWRVTGSPVKMPYVADAEQYSVTPLFIWENLRAAPHYNNGDLQYFYTHWNTGRPTEYGRFFRYWCFYVGPALTPLLAVALTAWTDRKMRFFVLLCAVCGVALAIEWWGFPQYAAPMTVAIYAVMMQGLRQMHAMFSRRRASRWRGLVPLLPAVIVAMILVRFVMPALSITPMPTWPAVWAAGGYGSSGRWHVLKFLRAQPGKQLVLVRYVNHDNDEAIGDEWIYNHADIDGSRIIWARELDEAHDRKLMQYFKDRQIWLCTSNDGKLVRLN